MRLVIQRVKQSKVMVENEVVGQIGPGLLVLIGIGEGDVEGAVDALVQKLSKLRIMSDENDKMNLSLKDTNGEILAVSQFTLYADTSAGNRPSFVHAAAPASAEPLYELFVQKLRDGGIEVATGKFGAYMQIESVLDGPVTIILEG